MQTTTVQCLKWEASEMNRIALLKARGAGKWTLTEAIEALQARAESNGCRAWCRRSL